VGRTVQLVLVTPDGTVQGSLPEFEVESGWWPDAQPVVEGARQRYRVELTVLRLLDAELGQQPGGRVTYLAEVAAPVEAALPWKGTLDEHPLRQPYARPGGPQADLRWATAALEGRGLRVSGPPQQVRTWNLSSIWRLPLAGTDSAAAWLKVVPPFFAHEGRMLERLQAWPVPRLIAQEDGRVLLGDIPGQDLYDADAETLLEMVSLLVRVQTWWSGREDELLGLGLPDWRPPGLSAAIADVVDRTSSELTRDERAPLERFVRELPGRWQRLGETGLPDTLVHGDFHPGNFRGPAGGPITLLDWGDSGVGHPLLDQPAFLDRTPPDAGPRIRERWERLWQEAVPGSRPGAAAALIAPIAAARQAVIYRRFLDGIEPSERVYHRADPADWMRRTVALLTPRA
jgi:Phosphotransferase enzyme family